MYIGKENIKKNLWPNTRFLEGIMNFIIYAGQNIVEDIQIRALGCAGDMTRMEDERIPPKNGSQWKVL
jgi:hypothetical protein